MLMWKTAFVLMCLTASLAFAQKGGGSASGRTVPVSGYRTKDGTVVAPYRRAAPGEGIHDPASVMRTVGGSSSSAGAYSDTSVAAPIWALPAGGVPGAPFYIAAGSSDDVVAHYKDIFSKSGVVSEASFDGLGVTIHAASADTNCVMRVKPRYSGDGVEVRVSCAQEAQPSRKADVQ